MAYDNSLSAEHISSNLTEYEAGRTGFFSLIIDSKINGILKATYKGKAEDATVADRFNNAQDVIRLNVTNVDLTDFTLRTLTYRRGNEIVTCAGVPEYSSGSFTIDDVVGQDSKGVLMALRNAAYNPITGKAGRMSDYKMNYTLIEYTADYEPVRQFKVCGAWISGLSTIKFDKENDDRNKVTATVVYDKIIPLDAEGI